MELTYHRKGDYLETSDWYVELVTFGYVSFTD